MFMINTLLLLGIVLFFCYAFYDQFVMDLWKGKTLLKVHLKKQAKKDAVIFIVLIFIIIYQAQANISSVTLYLLGMLIVLTVYAAFVRAPVLLLKEKGFFFGNLYFQYDKINQINLAENNILVIDLITGKRLLAHLLNEEDKSLLVQFFGGYRK
ncbi:membrane protein [Pasteurella multocida]|nr:membrane protein [Pasteurella multocida]